MTDHHAHLRQYYQQLLNSPDISFSEIAGMKKVIGVYIIYSPHKDILYIGSTNNYNVRFGTDLKHESTHTLVRKMIKRGVFTHRKEVTDYLMNKCSYKIQTCLSKREAEALEHFCIWVLNPEYNK